MTTILVLFLSICDSDRISLLASSLIDLGLGVVVFLIYSFNWLVFQRVDIIMKILCIKGSG